MSVMHDAKMADIKETLFLIKLLFEAGYVPIYVPNKQNNSILCPIMKLAHMKHVFRGCATSGRIIHELC